MWGENPCELAVLIQGPCVCKIKERYLQQTDGWMDRNAYYNNKMNVVCPFRF